MGDLRTKKEENQKLFIDDRWRAILDQLTPDSVTSVEALSQALRVSLATVRRDLAELHDAGRLRRVRGGAVALPKPDTALEHLFGQAGFDDSKVSNPGKKRAIGERAAQMIEDGESIIIDGGTTTLELANHLSAQNIMVLTTSIPILVALVKQNNVRVLITGGEVFKRQNVILNPYQDNIVHHFSATKLFIGAQAISPTGLMQTDPLLVQNEQDLIGRAEKIVVLADSSKFRARASLSVCPLGRIDTVITDAGIEADDRRMLERENVDLVVVER